MSNPSDNPPQGDGLIAVKEVVALCPDARSVVIVGACDAWLPLEYRRFLPYSRIVAIEGLPENFERWLKDSDQFEPICAVVSKCSGEANFFVQRRNGTHSLYDRGDCFESRVVRTMTLDELLLAIGVDHVDVLSIDVEGAAADVLEGATNTLKTAQVVVVETETEEFFKGQRLAPESHAYLKAAGLRQLIDCKAEVLEQKFQHEELWAR